MAGGEPCTSVEFLAEFVEIKCSVDEGAGTNISLEISVDGQSVISNFSYQGKNVFPTKLNTVHFATSQNRVFLLH